MSSDLPLRLRSWVPWLGGNSPTLGNDVKEAADAIEARDREIERLRGVLAEISGHLEIKSPGRVVPSYAAVFAKEALAPQEEKL